MLLAFHTKRKSERAESPQNRAPISQRELDQEVAQDVPDREAMSTLGLPAISLPIDSISIPVGELSSIDTTLAQQLPPEASNVDLEALAEAALSDDGDILATLPPELVPDTTQVTETGTIGGT